MSAEIIQFPKSPKIRFTLNGGESVRFPDNWPYKIAGQPVNPPHNAREYLELCKQFLEPDDYSDLCISIMDKEAYDAMEDSMRTLVDNYYNLLSKITI